MWVGVLSERFWVWVSGRPGSKKGRRQVRRPVRADRSRLEETSGPTGTPESEHRCV